jgi:lysophospholipase
MLTASNLPAVSRTPTIGIALSGGGYRAMINGLGMTQGLMAASEEATKAGTGGWFDALSYMAGLSGGSWATGSFFANNGILPTDLVTNVWNLDQNLIYPSDGKVAFYTNMLQNVREKAKRGFPTQITDYWALALGEHLLPEQYRMENGANFTISSIPTSISAFQNASLPFPIIIAAE